jgi:hypothetical protein
MNFSKITTKDKDVITAFTLKGSSINCDFAFANMCSWQFLYDSEFAVENDFLFIRFYVEEKYHRHLAYMIPVGEGDMRTAIDMLDADANAMGFTPLILGVTPDFKNKLNELFPGKYSFITERDYFDYIYLREDLATLKGKKFQSKRNHINRFNSLYEYEYVPITPEIVPQCLEVERVWRKMNANPDETEGLSNEQRSMTFALEHFDELGLMGGAIMVEGKIIAFTYGSPVNATVFSIHVEKANITYEGAFSVINREFASRIPDRYVYLNREEDLGLPGLRKSKMSYNPVILLEKNAAVRRRQ